MPSGALQFKQSHWRTRRWWVLTNFACNSDSFILNIQSHNITSYWRFIELCYSRSRLVCKASFMFTCRCEWFIWYDSGRIRLAHKVRSITNTPDVRSTPSPAPRVRPKRCRRTSAIKLAASWFLHAVKCQHVSLWAPTPFRSNLHSSLCCSVKCRLCISVPNQGFYT